MIDESDGDFALLASGGGGVVFSLIMIAVAVTLYAIASQNADECARLKCSAGHVGKLLDHECVCVEVAKERR